MKDINIPVSVVGAGSQPADPDGAVNDFMNLPDEMMTFAAPIIPEAEEIEGLEDAIALSEELVDILKQYNVGELAKSVVLDDLDDKNRHYFDQLLGEGEVSVQCLGNMNALIQESVLAGVWRVQYVDENKNILRDTIEVGSVPALVQAQTFEGAQETLDIDNLEIPENVYNAPPLLTELRDKLPEWDPEVEPHVINLSLLPHTEEDLAFLSDVLGIGPIIILSRGYGNCRISSTKTKNVWWVQYFNSQETLILNTLEITDIPEVACAAKEDIADSAERLEEMLSIYK